MLAPIVFPRIRTPSRQSLDRPSASRAKRRLWEITDEHGIVHLVVPHVVSTCARAVNIDDAPDRFGVHPALACGQARKRSENVIVGHPNSFLSHDLAL